MSALTSVFNFLYVYVRVFVSMVVGSSVDIRDFSPEQSVIVRSIFDGLGFPATWNKVFFDSEPILLLILGIFALGSIIGLTRRLMR